jgi:hypothetical protein|tara:strand:- start:359 stop:550 length:192 start_codon:yes stop_codon:yes gene_type:complete
MDLPNNFTYKLLGTHTTPECAGKPIEGILRKEDNVFIPPDPDNTDWKDFQEWLAAGNTPEAAG